MLDTKSPIIVTGATGYLASHVVELLLKKGYLVRGTVRKIGAEKNKHLLEMENASKNLELVELDLHDSVDKFVQAFKGCEYLIHTASPFSMTVEDSRRDLVEPAIAGTRSAMQAASTVGIKKIILTSSMAAITDEPIPGVVFDESYWNERSTLYRNPYYLSKTLAEREAWKFVEELPEDKKIQLVVMNPGMVIGPAHTKLQGVNESCSCFEGLMTRKYAAIISLAWMFVDVRDVAIAHVNGLENPKASGRHLLLHPKGVLPMRQVIDIMKKHFPNYPYPALGLDNSFGNYVAYMMSYRQPGQIGAYVRTHIGVTYEVNVSKSQKELGVNYRDVEGSIVDSCNNPFDFGFVAKK